MSCFENLVAEHGNNSRSAFARDVALAWGLQPFVEGIPASMDFKGVSNLQKPNISMITGYPAELDYTGDSGDYFLHSTAPDITPFKPAVGPYLYATHISTGPGNSGGPVWAQDELGNWKAAGVRVSGRPSVTGVYGRSSDIKSFPDEATVSKVTLQLDISTAHRGDLVVALLGPGGVMSILHNGEGDVLAVTDPDLAGVIAREVLATTTSGEEFTVALKPLLLGGPWQAPDGELEAHLTRLLENPAWQDQVGLAEALDLPRVAASHGSAEILARWVDRSPPAKAAGEMALHETAATNPSLVIELVAGDRQLFHDEPDLRAGLLARATASDPAQTASLGDYLKDPAVSLDEKQRFLSLFPLRSASTGFRLYGSPPAPYDAASVKADDKAALEVVKQWKRDPALSSLQGDLATLEERLQAWVAQSGG